MKPAVLKRFKKLWRGLLRLHSKLCFSQQQMKTAMVLVWKARDTWDLTDAQGDEQTTVMAKRLRCALRHIAQARRKTKPPRWYLELFGDSGVAEGEAEEGEGSEESEESEECNKGEECDEEEERVEGKMCVDREKCIEGEGIEGKTCIEGGDGDMCKEGDTCNEGEDWPYIGWDSELEMAYRAKAQGGRKAARQTSNVLVEPPAGEGFFMKAKFNDGKIYELTDLTVEDYRSLVAAKKEKKDSRCQVLWSATHAVTSLEVSIRPRETGTPCSA